MKAFPETQGHSPDYITGFQPVIDSTCHIWKALAWMDHAKRTSTLSSVQYAALDLRLGIENPWWENLFLSQGGKMTRQEVKKYRNDSTTLYKVIKRLAPEFRKLVEFTRIVGTQDEHMPSVTAWDIDGELCRLHGGASQYLHVDGESLDTIGDQNWLKKACEFIGEGAKKIQKQMGRTGVMVVSEMQPEVLDAWEAFKAGKIDADSIRKRLSLGKYALRVRGRERREGERRAALLRASIIP